eukprot:TRINITY_DN2629_c0_g1_i2.p1 TRINITY_DN2629_c0_g1~~TRINITY_DN2629_c0_g1_i2.p1  ORF type:complete len:143 (-),score=17.25 TRINITY_DN2629_c0_g1_i2:468-896(-)
MSCGDDLVWNIINNGFCSYKAKADTVTFCRNKYNTTGICSRRTCPLSNSRYATILEKDGVISLHIKTAERNHLPKDQWEIIPLSRNYAQALQQIDEHLQYWPKFVIHKNKQRLTKITQYLIRMRKLQKKKKDRLLLECYLPG